VLAAVQALPESDPMDVKTTVRIKAIASSETTVRGIHLYVTNVVHTDSTTTVHVVLQNLWGRGTKLHAEPISVNLTGLDHAKFLDDQTGKTHLARTTDGPTLLWMAAPEARKELEFAFEPLPKASHSATLILPGFATVTGIEFGHQ
jgi:hypothetical protein